MDRRVLMRILTSILVIVPALVSGACMKRSDKYCGLHPEDVANCGDETGAECEIDDDCGGNGATPVCQVEQGVCVQCVAEPGRDTACAGMTPICDATSCRGCTADTECVSNFCVSDGSCASTDQVAYVSETGSGTECTAGMPCGELDDAELTLRPFIKIIGNVSLENTTRFDRGQRTIHGSGASLIIEGGRPMIEIGAAGTSLEIEDLVMTTTSNGSEQPVIEAISAGATLTLQRVTIHDANGHAIEATLDTMVTIRRSVIANNRADMPALNLTGGQFDITNTIIVGNGGAGALYGAARLVPSGSIAVFAFNTVADNDSMMPTGTRLAISCDNGMVDSSIVLGGRFGSDCNARYSLYDIPPMSPPDPSNRNGVPTFLNETTVMSPMFYRLAPGSLGIDVANPNATLTYDIDDQLRPNGDGPDIGADETP